MKTQTNYTNIPTNETTEQRLVRHAEYLLRENEIWFTDPGKKSPNFPVSVYSSYVGLKTAVNESKAKTERINSSDPTMDELIFKLNEMSDLYKQETQEQWRKGTLSKKIVDEVMPLAMKVGGSTFDQVNIIWSSSRMADKHMVSLTLELLASNLYISEYQKR